MFLDGFYGDIVVPNVIYDLEVKNKKINQTKQPPPGWDENFDIVEPKMDPYSEEMDKQTEAPAEKHPESWRLRLHKERKRRIQNTGDPETFEIKELVKKTNQPDAISRRVVEILKDGSNVDQRDLQEKVTGAKEREVTSSRRHKKVPRRNDKRLRIREQLEEVLSEDNNPVTAIRSTTDTRSKRRRKRKKKDKRFVTSIRYYLPIPIQFIPVLCSS